MGKWKFHVTKICYLDLIIFAKSIRLDPKKFEAIPKWKIPSCLKNVKAFIGFENFYLYFITAFWHIERSMINIIKKDKSFCWTADCQESFELFKECFTIIPILTHFKFETE